MVRSSPSSLLRTVLGTKGPPRRVYLLDESRMARAALRRMIQGAGGFDVVGEGARLEYALHDAPELEPDLIVLDPFHGIEPHTNASQDDEGAPGLERLGALLPSSWLVVATSDEDRALNELQLGDPLRALVSKSGDPQEVVRALRAASDGAWFVCPRFAGRFRRPFPSK